MPKGQVNNPQGINQYTKGGGRKSSNLDYEQTRAKAIKKMANPRRTPSQMKSLRSMLSSGDYEDMKYAKRKLHR